MIFLGFAFRYPEIRRAVEAAAAGIADIVCADDTLTGVHLLEKITDMMCAADLCIFDLTAHNVNVAVEYGLARGLGLNPLILYNDSEELRPTDYVHDIFSDLRGLDSLRYRSVDELSRTLRLYLPGALADRESRANRAAQEIEERNLATRPHLRVSAEMTGPDDLRRLHDKQTSMFHVVVTVSNEDRGVADPVKLVWSRNASQAGEAQIGPIGSTPVKYFIAANWTLGQPTTSVPDSIVVNYEGAGGRWSGDCVLSMVAGTNPPKWHAIQADQIAPKFRETGTAVE